MEGANPAAAYFSAGETIYYIGRKLEYCSFYYSFLQLSEDINDKRVRERERQRERKREKERKREREKD